MRLARAGAETDNHSHELAWPVSSSTKYQTATLVLNIVFVSVVLASCPAEPDFGTGRLRYCGAVVKERFSACHAASTVAAAFLVGESRNMLPGGAARNLKTRASRREWSCDDSH